jgi:hypothetical protein
MSTANPEIRRCAIYTRKSSEDGLEQAIARGHCWFEQLASGGGSSLGAFATRESINPSQIRRLTRLGFRAPEIVEAIVAGK